MNGHHLILGNLVDFITGKTINDTHDERYQQKLARLLVETKGYQKKEIQTAHKLQINLNSRKNVTIVDFMITISDRILMIVKYGPGSIITRYRPSLSASRLLAPYQIPVVVVTNGEDAHILEGTSGDVISTGLESIPSRSELINQSSDDSFTIIPQQNIKMESRIICAFEVDGCCPDV